MIKKPEFDPKSAIYTPQQVATYGIEAIRDVKTNEDYGIGIDIAEIRDYFAPVRPGQVCAVYGQTSHYKSGFLHFIEHQAAKGLTEQGRENEIIVHVSVEECVEEQAFLEFARHSGEDAGAIARGQIQNWDALEASTIKVGNIPIYRIGDSLARAEDMPNLYLTNMIRSVKYLANDLLDWKPKIAGLFFDYLQAFPIDPEHKLADRMNQRRLQVRSDIYRLRQAAAHFHCPVFVAVQAKQELNGAKPPIMIPGMYDANESADIAQRCDRIISLWMPKHTSSVGEMLTANNFSFIVAENQLWIKVTKQRGGLPSGKAWLCFVDFITNTIAPLKQRERGSYEKD